MINVIIVDDEKAALDELNYLLGKVSNVNIIGSYISIVDALEIIEDAKADLVFLDIDMPELSGLAAAQEIMALNKKIDIVFITAHDKYAVNAFEVNAIDYILKPISFDRLSRCVKKSENNKNINEKLNAKILEQIQSSHYSLNKRLNKIIVWQNDAILLIKPDDILYITTDNGHTSIVTNEGTYESRNTLNAWEGKLSSYDFFRCHRAFLVNMDRVGKIIKWFGNTYKIHMEGIKDPVPVSKRSALKLKEIMEID